MCHLIPDLMDLPTVLGLEAPVYFCIHEKGRTFVRVVLFSQSLHNLTTFQGPVTSPQLRFPLGAFVALTRRLHVFSRL